MSIISFDLPYKQPCEEVQVISFHLRICLIISILLNYNVICSKLSFLISSTLYLKKFAVFGEIKRKKSYPHKGQDSRRQTG